MNQAIVGPDHDRMHPANLPIKREAIATSMIDDAWKRPLIDGTNNANLSIVYGREKTGPLRPKEVG